MPIYIFNDITHFSPSVCQSLVMRTWWTHTTWLSALAPHWCQSQRTRTRSVVHFVVLCSAVPCYACLHLCIHVCLSLNESAWQNTWTRVFLLYFLEKLSTSDHELTSIYPRLSVTTVLIICHTLSVGIAGSMNESWNGHFIIVLPTFFFCNQC